MDYYKEILVLKQKLCKLQKCCENSISAADLTIDTTRPTLYIGDGEMFGDPDMSIVGFLEKTLYASSAAIVSMSGGTNLEKNTTSLTQTLVIGIIKEATTANIDSVVVTSLHSSSSGDIKTGTGSQTINHNINLTTNQDDTYTVTVTTTDGKVSTSTTSFKFLNYMYVGTGAVPGSFDSAFIHNLEEKTLTNTYVEESYFTVAHEVDAAAGEYIWWAIPDSFVDGMTSKPPYIYLSSPFAGGMERDQTSVTYTYEDGTIENYTIYKTDEAGLGSTSVIIKDS